MFEIKIIESGYIMADGGAMFGAIPKRAWQRKYAGSEDNLCPLAMRCVLAISGDRKILTDTGMGDKHLNKMSYYQPHSLVGIGEEIKKYGLCPGDITDVVLTHLHFDHCGYATKAGENGELIPSFPNARYWLSRKQWDNYRKPNRLEADSILAENIQPVYDAGLLHLIDNDSQICEGFEVRLFDGHSNGQLVAYIHTDTGVYTFPGDLIPTSAHVPLEWISAYDINALKSLEEKGRFLWQAERENYILIYCHDAKVQMSRVKRLNDDYKASF
ncbi:MBL fold metallo-hydrolase [Dysgonomonas sp. 521]|uniref:MBL fold metallo-hydrolase n=1 Tax=Dysgonomonas sp. 521 TaxID=2302932 RepID=UPI0013D319A6|nr:MBL fold metallo-hydrolase [Dysgonomonas sp. 521]NDV96635.1 MBL fold metallo-hydrolase [Dysgonomonas sp. 521]